MEIVQMVFFLKLCPTCHEGKTKLNKEGRCEQIALKEFFFFLI